MRLWPTNIQLNLTRGAAPNLPPKNTDGTLTEIMPPFGTQSPQGAITTVSGGAMDSRLIQSDPRELWYLNLPSKLTPAQVLQILRSALGGDIWQQWQLCSIMMDSWPMLRKCSHELREAVSQSQFKIDPFSVNGEEPTDTASEKADLVRRAFANFKPNQFTDEEDLSGAIYDFCDSMLNGLTVSEILWQTVKTKDHGTEKYPRAICWVHPRHFTFTNDGMVAVYDSNYARTYYSSADQNAKLPDPRKFICSQFKSRSGSSLGAGLMRPVAYDWSAVMFNREWMLKSAQTFGSPFVDVTYKPGTQPNELAKLDQEIAAGLANRFIRHVEGTIINVSPAQAKTGAGNNQMMLMELADKHVCELFLGSEGTTKMTPGKMGGSQQNSSQENTKRERVEGLARWVAAEPLQQLARAILLVNYGEDSECPTIAADFTEIQDPMEAAQRMQIICAPGMPPIVADEFYDAMKLTKPEPDDQVILGGKIGLMGDTEQEIDPNPQQPEAPQPALDENNNPLPAQKINPEDAALQMKMAKAKVKGSDFELGEFIYGGAPRGNRNAAKDYQAGQEVKFEGTAADGSGTSGMFPVKIVNPHSNADKVTHSDKRGREYEGAFSHISTATVENIRSGKQFEAHHFSLSAPPVKASHRSTDLKTLLGHASDDDIAELQDLVKAAEQATHMNGEHNRVKAKLQELQDKLS